MADYGQDGSNLAEVLAKGCEVHTVNNPGAYGVPTVLDDAPSGRIRIDQ